LQSPNGAEIAARKGRKDATTSASPLRLCAVA